MKGGILPESIQNLIFSFLSHPCADMIREVAIKMKRFGWGDDFATNFFIHYVKHGRVYNYLTTENGFESLPHLFIDFY